MSYYLSFANDYKTIDLTKGNFPYAVRSSLLSNGTHIIPPYPYAVFFIDNYPIVSVLYPSLM
jgi:hypothetical protein